MSKKEFTDMGNTRVELCKAQKLNKKEIDALADALAISFKGYPLFEYFLNYKYSVPKMKLFWKVSLKTMLDFAQVVSIDERKSAIAVLIPNQSSNISFWKYFRSGGLWMILRLGFFSAKRMTHFVSFAESIKAKYASSDCWYFYALVTMPELRGHGLGSTVLRSVEQFLDENGQDCYLETMSPVNVDIYTHYGFELKETVSIPNTDMTLYAMLRSPKKPESDAK